MLEKIKKLLLRLEEIELLLSKEETFLDKNLFKALSQEHSYLNSIKDTFIHYRRISEELDLNKNLLLSEKDEEMISMVKEEINSLENKKEFFQKELEALLVPKDPRDDRNIILEIRAGTGGDEAALFVSDCAKMYKAYADKKKWSVEVISASDSDAGGYKDYIMGISGKGVFRFLQYEAGTHRVQRVPETETQGRLHTSAITVAILMEPEKKEVEIDEKELKIDTYRASGAGGQHVNVTDSAVRITHLPTNTVVCCQDERSQHKNKAKGMRLLLARIAEKQKKQSQKELSSKRQAQIGSGDRSERIRTYNFPQNRVTDHRIDLTLHKLDRIMQGELEEITSALVSFFYQKQLSE